MKDKCLVCKYLMQCKGFLGYCERQEIFLTEPKQQCSDYGRREI